MARQIVSLLLFTVAFHGGPQAAPEPSWTTDAVVKRVKDGDTLTVAIYRELDVRLLDCWAPETRTRDESEKRRGIASKQHLTELLGTHARVRMSVPLTDNPGDATSMSRVLAHVWSVDHRGRVKVPSVNRQMVIDGFATEGKQ